MIPKWMRSVHWRECHQKGWLVKPWWWWHFFIPECVLHLRMWAIACLMGRPKTDRLNVFIVSQRSSVWQMQTREGMGERFGGWVEDIL